MRLCVPYVRAFALYACVRLVYVCMRVSVYVCMRACVADCCAIALYACMYVPVSCRVPGASMSFRDICRT